MYLTAKHITISDHLFQHSFIIMHLNPAAQVQVKKYTKFSKHISIVQQLPYYPTKWIHPLLPISFLDADI